MCKLANKFKTFVGEEILDKNLNVKTHFVDAPVCFKCIYCETLYTNRIRSKVSPWLFCIFLSFDL